MRCCPFCREFAKGTQFKVTNLLRTWFCLACYSVYEAD